MKKKKPKKKRSKHYESKLKIHGTFDEAVRVLVGGGMVNQPNK